MADLNIEISETPESSNSNEVEYSPIQIKAIEQGWIPKEEFDGDPDAFIDAPEFVRRGELFGKIEHQSKELKNLRNALEALKTHHTKVKETEYQRALTTLQNARKQAVVEGEHERAFAIEDQIDAIKAEKEQFVREAQQPIVQEDTGYTQEFQSWVDRNNWYESNEVMRGAADTLGRKLHAGGMSPQEVLVAVEKEIRKEFAHKFRSVGRPQAVEPSSRSGSSSSSFQMDETERSIMRKIVASGIMTEAEYIKDLKNTRK